MFSGAPSGGSLFSNKTPLFGGQNALFKSASKEEEEDDGEEGGNEPLEAEDDEPPAFAAGGASLIPGVTDKPA